MWSRGCEFITGKVWHRSGDRSASNGEWYSIDGQSELAFCQTLGRNETKTQVSCITTKGEWSVVWDVRLLWGTRNCNLPERPPLLSDHLTKILTGSSVNQIVINKTSDMPFASCFKASPSAKPFIWKLVLFTRKFWFIYMWILTNFHMKGFALRLALKQRRKAYCYKWNFP